MNPDDINYDVDVKMKRNEDRLWFDRGYRQAMRDSSLDAFWPRLIGFWFLLGVAIFYWPAAVFILSWYTLFSYIEYRDKKKHGRDEDVPPLWEQKGFYFCVPKCACMADGYYKCDRCGEFEKGPIKRSGLQYNRDVAEPEYRKIKYGHLTGEDDSGSISRTVDLCHECRKELTAWINREQ